MRKIFSCFLISVLIIAAFTGCKQNEAPGNAATEGTVATDNPNAETSPSTPIESPATDFAYEVSQDGKHVYINQYVGTSETVVIPSKIDGLPVVSLMGVFENDVLKQGAFEGSNIKSVMIPESVTAIGSCAFKDCTELTQVTVSGDLNRVLANAFRNCVKLESIDLSRTKLRIIGTGAFYGCTGLSEIKFSNDLTEIELGAFRDCTALLELDFPDSLEKIGNSAFVNCTSLKTVVIPEKLELLSLSASSFYNVPSLEKIIFKEGRKEINGYAFFSITSNPEITIPKSVEKFSPYPFFIYGGAKFVFFGNCPEIIEKTDFYGDPTIYYDPSTDGWDACVWKDQYPLLPTNATSLPLDAAYAYTVISTQEADTLRPTKVLTITDKASGKTIQTLRFSENEWFTKDPLYLMDVTFDGNIDLLVPFSCSASGAFFQAYVWDAENGQYRYIPSFENLPNVALDAANGTLLSHRTASQITSYGMYTYCMEEKAFIPIRSLYWEPQENQQSLLVTETAYTADGAKEQVRQFSVSATATGVDKTDAQMAPYFNSDSLWALDSEKWNNTVIPHSALVY